MDQMEAVLRRIQHAEQRRDAHVRRALRWTWRAHREREKLRRHLAREAKDLRGDG